MTSGTDKEPEARVVAQRELKEDLQTRPNRSDYEDFRDFEKALVAWATWEVVWEGDKCLVERLRKKYRARIYNYFFNDGSFTRPPYPLYKEVSSLEEAISLAQQAAAGNKPGRTLAEVVAINAERRTDPHYGMMLTSTGDWVPADDWDDIEGNL